MFYLGGHTHTHTHTRVLQSWHRFGVWSGWVVCCGWQQGFKQKKKTNRKKASYIIYDTVQFLYYSQCWFCYQSQTIMLWWAILRGNNSSSSLLFGCFVVSLSSSLVSPPALECSGGWNSVAPKGSSHVAFLLSLPLAVILHSWTCCYPPPEGLTTSPLPSYSSSIKAPQWLPKKRRKVYMSV